MKINSGVAVSCIIGFVAGMALTNNSIDKSESYLVFLFYCLVTSFVISENNEEDSPLFLYSMPSPTVMVLVTLFSLYFHGSNWISGEKFLGTWIDYVQILTIWIAAIFAIWIFSFGIERIVHYIKILFSMTKEKMDHILKVIKWLITIFGLVIVIGKFFI